MIQATESYPEARSTPVLPRLREDLVLIDGPPGADGGPTWRVYDPLRHRYIAIDRPTCLVMSLLPAHETAEDLVAAVASQTGRQFSAATLAELLRFMQQQNLTEAGAGFDWRTDPGMRLAGHGMVMSLVHSYLFFRIPLFAPERILQATSKLVEPLFRRSVQIGILLIGILGLFLVSRQWETFVHDARFLSTGAGLTQFGIMLFAVKVLHEFGHAHTARRYGCRVPVIGIAFMMMAPVLYTDVTDAWRLQDRSKRLSIDAAGIAVELGVACLATFLWVFLPEGSARQIVFLLATTSWIMSIAVNLNPLMRFDGYYIAADLAGIENLQERAFAFGTWRLREILFGLGHDPPEYLTRTKARFLAGYAWCVWIYRVVLFTAIALAVYAYFFKLLGILLFLFELGYFLARPIVAEVQNWWRLRRKIVSAPRARWTAAGLIAAALLFFIPWSSEVKIPALLEAESVSHVYAPRAARIREVLVRTGAQVRRNDVLVRLEAPDTENQKRLALARLSALQLRLDRALSDKEDREEKLVLEGSKTALIVLLDGLARELGELVVRAPTDGILAELNPVLQPGRWIGMKEPIALVRGTEQASITGYVSEANLWRIVPGAAAKFVADVHGVPDVSATLTRIATGSTPWIELAELTNMNGGPIEVQADARQRSVATTSHYGVGFTVAGRVAVPEARQRGSVYIQGAAESYFSAVWRRILKVLVRESAA